MGERTCSDEVGASGRCARSRGSRPISRRAISRSTMSTSCSCPMSTRPCESSGCDLGGPSVPGGGSEGRRWAIGECGPAHSERVQSRPRLATPSGQAGRRQGLALRRVAPGPLPTCGRTSEVMEHSLMVHDELLGRLTPRRRRVLRRLAVGQSFVRAREAKRLLKLAPARPQAVAVGWAGNVGSPASKRQGGPLGLFGVATCQLLGGWRGAWPHGLLRAKAS